jgi:hypothetical protein
MASPESFGADYNECRLPYDFDAVTEEHIERWIIQNDQDIDQYLTRRVMNENYGISGALLKGKVSELKWNHLFYDEANRAEFMLYDRQRTNEILGVFCTSYNIISCATWTELGNLGTAYAIEFDTNCLHHFIQGATQEVVYYNRLNPPKIFPLSYSYEDRVAKALKEVRCVPNSCIDENEIRFTKTKDNWSEDRAITLSNECYRAIYVGPECRDNDEIIQARNQHLPNIPVYRTRYDGNSVVCSEKI